MNLYEMKQYEKSLFGGFKTHLDDMYEDFINQECEKIITEIRRKMKAEQDRVILNMLKSYTMERHGDSLQIRVEHFYKEPTNE